MIAISMRMTRHIYPGGGEEVRDALAHDWWRFLETALPGMRVFPVPNIGESVERLVQELPLTGLILSGGDDWGVFPQRDLTEKTLVRWAERRQLPILGVCRGAQVLNLLLGGRVAPGFGTAHVRTRHALQTYSRNGAPMRAGASVEVNSYHSCAIRQEDLAPALTPWAVAGDGTVEGFCRSDGRIMGILWHPERETTAQTHDIHLFQALLQEKA